MTFLSEYNNCLANPLLNLPVPCYPTNPNGNVPGFNFTWSQFAIWWNIVATGTTSTVNILINQINSNSPNVNSTY